jgi:hypothetical protein
MYMICPHCHAETSDMMNACELCGQRLFDTTEPTAAYASPGDATIWPRGPNGEPPPPEASNRPPGGMQPGSQWYLRPWPYVIGIAIVAVVVVSLLLFHTGAKGHVALLVDGRPTVLDFYTDT